MEALNQGIAEDVVMVIMTVHNRRNQTLQCIEALLDSVRTRPYLRVSLVIVDTGSDGTGDAVKKIMPVAEIVPASDDVYWAQGMQLAWDVAAAQNWTSLLWLNDDVVLAESWYDTLVACSSRQFAKDAGVVFVGSCEDPVTRYPTYGGFRRVGRRHLLRFEPIVPNGSPQLCDTINGNVVLVPRSVTDRIGGFPRGYIHNLADLAFGLDAGNEGVDLLLSPVAVGSCSRNTPGEDRRGRVDRVRSLTGPKNYPPRPWFRFCIKYGGPLGAITALRPYIKGLLKRSTVAKSHQMEGDPLV